MTVIEHRVRREVSGSRSWTDSHWSSATGWCVHISAHVDTRDQHGTGKAKTRMAEDVPYQSI